MVAYKFLSSGRLGPFSRFQWPEPGMWVNAPPDLQACRSGIHACRTEDLPWWLADELWKVELAGEVRRDEHKIVAATGCLRSRVEAWTTVCAQEYADACAWRAQARGIQALERAGHQHAADDLAACATLDEVLSTSRGLAGRVPDTRISLTIAGDGAIRALTGAAPTTAYIAAHAAQRLDGSAGYAAERAWQAQWLIDRLALTETDKSKG
jgi:hypothetical protein